MYEDIIDVLYTNEQIVNKCEELGKLISKDYQGKTPILIGFLKGCMPFMAELIKHITIDMEYDFMDISSYFGTTESTGHVKINKDLSTDIMNRHVIIVEDIVDTGLTLSEILPILRNRKCKSLEIVTLLDKPLGRKVENLNPKYTGFIVPKLFLVGFGLDYQQLYRNTSYIGVLKESVYKK